MEKLIWHGGKLPMKRVNQSGSQGHRDHLLWNLLKFVENQKQLLGAGHAAMWTTSLKLSSMPSPDPISVGTTTIKSSNSK
jgi:hypothetical protein